MFYIYIVGTAKKEMHQEYAANGHSPTIPNGSYQMPSPMHHNHHQQNNHIQQSTIPQGQLDHNHKQLQSTISRGQHCDHHQQNVPTQQPVMHHQPLRQYSTLRNHNTWAGPTMYKPQFEVPQTNGHYIKKQEPLVKNNNTLPRYKIPVNTV